MPRLWAPNIEEVLPENDVNYKSVFVPKTLEIFPRYLLCLSPGDRILSPRPLPEGFCAYIARVSGLGPVTSWLMEVKGGSDPYSLAESTLADTDVMRQLKVMGRSGGWTLEPFIESPRILRLSRETGIPTDKTRPDLVLNGTVTRFNDKGYFKDFAKRLGVATVPGYIADSMPALEKAIGLTTGGHEGRAMLRKTLYGGGLGNLSGTPGSLLEEIQIWYNGGRVLIEPFLPPHSVAGSLAAVTADGVRFRGVDLQTFADGKWTGFDFPHPDAALARRIEELTLRLAEAAAAEGARGYLNFDWACSGGEPLSLECNMRNNGFAYVLDFAAGYFGGPRLIRYREGVKTRAADTRDLVEALSSVTAGGRPLLIAERGQDEGAVIMTPPLRGACSIAIFGKTHDYIREATLKLAEEAGL